MVTSSLWRLGATRKLYVLMLVVCAGLSGCSISLGQAQQVTPGNGITVPVQVVQVDGATQIDAALTIDGHGPYTFVLDTGAETSAIDSSLARRLGLKRDGATHQVGGIGGTVEAVPVGIDSWSLDKLRLPAMSVDSVPLTDALANGEGGLLGSDILSKFGTITINFTSQQLTVYKQIA
jgi:predicted aspartyl protease